MEKPNQTTNKPCRKIARFAISGLLFMSGLASAQQNVTVTAIDPADRLAGAAVLGEWATAGDVEVWAGWGVTGLAAVGGALVGSDTSTTVNGSVSRTAIAGGPDLDLGFNDYLQLRLKLPASYSGDVRIEYGTTTNTGFASKRQFVLPAASIVKDGAFHTYRLDMGLEVLWRDTLSDIRITPLLNTTGQFEIDYVEVGDVAGTAPALNTNTNFLAPLTANNTLRMASKHVCVWWDPADPDFTTTHARRALRMCEESYQVFCRKLGYNEPFREFGSTTTPRYKVNFVTWYGGFWAGGWANRGHMNVGAGGLGDEGWGNPVPHEFGHVVQMAQFGSFAGGHWESHANYLRAQRNMHFYALIPNAIPAIDNLTGNSNYRPDHKRHIYADQRYYLGLDDYGTQFGLPENFSASAWTTPPSGKTLIEKLAAALPVGTSAKDVACETLKYWPMLDFVEKAKLRTQHWRTTEDRNRYLYFQGAQLIPLQDKPGWWRVPIERAPDGWAYQMHDLTASAGATVTAEFRGLDMPGSGEDWRWCFAALSGSAADPNIRYSPVWAPGTQSFTLTSSETQVLLIATATPANTVLNLESLSNTKPVDKNGDRYRYAYEVRLVNATPAAHPFVVANPSGYHTHSNGGGIVGPSATVATTAYVGPNAKVIGSAKVLGNARIEDYAVVQGSATVQGNAVVSGSALIEGTALVEGDARVRDRAWLLSGAQVRGRALISGYTSIDNTTVQDDAIVRGCASPFGGGTISGTAILDHDYSMGSSVSSGVHFSHVPWGDWWDVYYPQTLTKPRGVIASYRTEESNGEEWWDEFGAQHAFLRGAPTRTSDDSLGTTVMSFDGVDDYAAFDRSLADTPLFSFCCWIKPSTAVGANEPLLFLGSSATKALQLRRDAAGHAAFTISNGTTNLSLTSTSELHQSAWQHVALTLNGSSGKLYVNGVLEASASTTLKALDILAANNHTALQANYLGRDWNGSLCKASFDDVRFYNQTLSADEVRAEAYRRGSILGQFSPTTATDFNGTSTIAQSGIRNGRVRTLAAWVKPHTSSDVSQYEPILDSADERDGAKGSGIGIDNSRWVARLDGPGLWNTGVSVVLNQWQHVALAFTGTTATLFVNGQQAAQRTYTGPDYDSAAAGKCYRIGFTQSTTDVATRQYFDGNILNARVYDKALSASELVLDADGDGFNDPDEITSGSNPLDSSSFPVYCWDGNDTTANADGGSGTWDTSTANWDRAPTGGASTTWVNAANVAIFGGTAGTVPLGTSITLGALNFISAGNYKINVTTTNDLGIRGGATVRVDAGTHEIAGAGAGSGSTSELQLNDSSTTGGATFDIASGASLNLNARMAGAGTPANTPIYKNGAGTLILSADNGGTNPLQANWMIIGGVLKVASTSNLGNSGGTVTVASGATLELAGANVVGTDGITLNGTGAGVGGALRISSGAVTVSQPAILNIASNIRVDTGASLIQSGTISGSGALTKTGDGTLTLSVANVHSGATMIQAGTLTLGHTMALQNSTFDTSGAGTLTLGAGVTTLTLGGLKGSTNLATVISAGYASVTDLILKSGTGVTNTYAGTIADGASGMTLTKTGAGTQILSGVNTYSGATTINGGTLQLAAGTNTIPAAGALVFSGSSTLNLGGNNQTLTGVAITTSAGSVTGTITNGSLTLNGSSDLTLTPSVTTGGITAQLDASGLASLIISKSGRNINVGGASNATGNASTGVFKLSSTANMITAAAMNIGATPAIYNAVSYINNGVMELGTLNTINADTWIIGNTRSSASVAFQSGLTSPVVTLRGQDGSSRVTSVTVGQNWAGTTAAPGTSRFDLGGGSVDLLVNTMILSRGATSGTTSPAVNGTFTMSAGTVDATSLYLSKNESSGYNTTNTSVFNHNGGDVKIGSLIFGQTTATSGAAPKFDAQYNLVGGILRAQDIKAGTGIFATASIRKVNFYDGTIANYDTMTDLTLNGVTGTGGTIELTLGTSGNPTFQVDPLRSITLGVYSSVTGSGSLIKSGAGKLTLGGANTYSGATTIKNGTLALGATGGLANSPLIVIGDAGSTSAVFDLTAKPASFIFGSGQTITGIGSLNIGSGKAVTIAGVLAPGNSIGTLSETGNLTLTGSYACELDATTADRLTVAGSLNVTEATLAISTLATPTAPSYVLASYTTTLTGTFAVTGLPSGYALQYNAAAKQILLVQQSLLVPQSYGEWAALKGLSGDAGADSDRDGSPDAVEFVLGDDPNTANAGGPATSLDDGSLVFTFRRDHASRTPDVSLNVEVGTSLGAWPGVYHVGSDTASSSPGITVTDEGAFDTIRLIINRAGAGSKFVRLRVTVTP